MIIFVDPLHDRYLADRADQHPAMTYRLVDFLINQGAYLEFSNPSKNTALHLAAVKVGTMVCKADPDREYMERINKIKAIRDRLIIHQVGI